MLARWDERAKEPALRARRALERLLDGVRGSSRGESAWRASRLTPNGYPLELAFATDERALRYTAEIAAPEAEPAGRLARARELLRALGAGELPESEFSRYESLQRGAELHWGTWIGGRHDAGGDRYKLYVEVAKAGYEELVREWLGERALLERAGLRLVMIGQELPSGRRELYFHAGELAWWEIARLLGRFGLAAREEELAKWMDALWGRRVRQWLARERGGDFGFSVSPATESKPLVLTLLARAPRVLGDDARAREKLLGVASRFAVDLSDYEVLSGALGSASGGSHHGMIGIAIAEVGGLRLQVGIEPCVPGLGG